MYCFLFTSSPSLSAHPSNASEPRLFTWTSIQLTHYDLDRCFYTSWASCVRWNNFNYTTTSSRNPTLLCNIRMHAHACIHTCAHTHCTPTLLPHSSHTLHTPQKERCTVSCIIVVQWASMVVKWLSNVTTLTRKNSYNQLIQELWTQK